MIKLWIKNALQGASIVIGMLALFLLAADYHGNSILDFLLSKVVAIMIAIGAIIVYGYLENGGE